MKKYLYVVFLYDSYSDPYIFGVYDSLKKVPQKCRNFTKKFELNKNEGRRFIYCEFCNKKLYLKSEQIEGFCKKDCDS